MPTIDDDDVKHVLLQVRRLVLGPYPFPEGSVVDARYATALGLIAGIATEALLAKRQNRPASFVTQKAS